MYTPARGSKCLRSGPSAPQCPPGALYLKGTLRERTTGAESKAVSAPEVSAEGGPRRLGTTERRRGQPRTGHSAAANAESLDRAPSPASSPVTSISALSGFRSPPPDGRSRRRSLGGRSAVGWGEEAGRSVGAEKKTRPLRARARSFQGRCAGCVPWTCIPARGRVLSRAGGVPAGPRLHAAVRKEGVCRVGRVPPACGQMTPPAPDVDAPCEEANGCLRHCHQTRSPAPRGTSRTGRAPAAADCFVGLVRHLAEGEPSSQNNNRMEMEFHDKKEGEYDVENIKMETTN
ncbi:uncharacterized protein LOC111550136 [Piliocolobus tephrosceles]|uniref:uncharacterized protein LOC111550136 n=1 Tax=Piliocolobus tephrosceles TaxID=591936 RepID=UPI000C29A77D|nr:uncharacterized protein LOC111550136 [Piliocolobus tephrosceles]